MKERREYESVVNPKYMSRKQFSQYISVGLNKAMQVAYEAGVVVKCGNRSLIDVEKFDKWAEGRTKI